MFDDGIIIDGAWLPSGWQSILPEQSIGLHMPVTTATDRSLDGTLDQLVTEIGGIWFDDMTGGLDASVWWFIPATTAILWPSVTAPKPATNA